MIDKSTFYNFPYANIMQIWCNINRLLIFK